MDGGQHRVLFALRLYLGVTDVTYSRLWHVEIRQNIAYGGHTRASGEKWGFAAAPIIFLGVFF